jgi:hypothetical protein
MLSFGYTGPSYSPVHEMNLTHSQGAVQIAQLVKSMVDRSNEAAGF